MKSKAKSRSFITYLVRSRSFRMSYAGARHRIHFQLAYSAAQIWASTF